MASPQLEFTAAPAPRAVLLPFPGAGRVAHAPRAAVLGGPLPGRGRGARSTRGVVAGRPGVQPPLRLTRRGRRVVAGFSVVFGVTVAAATVTSESGGAGLELAGSTSVVVQAGDTLWSIAGEIAPEEDRRAVVDALLDVNGLSSVDLTPGQVLELP